MSHKMYGNPFLGPSFGAPFLDRKRQFEYIFHENGNVDSLIKKPEKSEDKPEIKTQTEPNIIDDLTPEEIATGGPEINWST